MVLYNDLVVYYKKMLAADAVADQDPGSASELVRSQIRNRLGWQELEHYQKTGQLLWKHPILQQKKQYNTLRKVKNQNPANLLLEHAKAKQNISRYNSLIANNKHRTPEQLSAWQALIAKHEVTMDIIATLVQEDAI